MAKSLRVEQLVGGALCVGYFFLARKVGGMRSFSCEEGNDVIDKWSYQLQRGFVRGSCAE